jgi:hypothetical protein
LHLYVSYDTMAEKFILMIIPFPQTLKTYHWSYYKNARKKLILTVCGLLANNIYFLVNTPLLYTAGTETNPNVIIKLIVCMTDFRSVHICSYQQGFAKRARSEWRLHTGIRFERHLIKSWNVQYACQPVWHFTFVSSLLFLPYEFYSYIK